MEEEIIFKEVENEGQRKKFANNVTYNTQGISSGGKKNKKTVLEFTEAR